jgi:hypothetical protein
MTPGTTLTTAEEAVAQRLEARVATALEAGLQRLEEARSGREAAREAEPTTRRVTLREAAGEVGLSPSEEEAIRRVYTDMEDRMLGILADPDGDRAAIRAEIEASKGDETRQRGLMMKYLPKVLPKLGDFMSMEMEKQTRIEEVLGPERAARFDDFDVEESHPFGLGGGFDVRADMRSR